MGAAIKDGAALHPLYHSSGKSAKPRKQSDGLFWSRLVWAKWAHVGSGEGTINYLVRSSQPNGVLEQGTLFGPAPFDWNF